MITLRSATGLTCLSLLVLATAAHGAANGPRRLGSTAAGSSSPGVNGNETFARTYQVSINGNAVVAGCGFRETGPPLSNGTITIAGIPPGATVVKAILNWTIVADAPPDPGVVFHSLTAPPATYPGTLLGSDDGPCWNPAFVFGYSLDVTCYVEPGGNGTYQVSVPDSGDANLSPTAEGAALTVVYCDSASPARDIVIYEGVQTQNAGTSSQTVTGFNAFGFGGGGADYAMGTFVVADGQGPNGVGWEAEARVNGSPVIFPNFDGDEGASCTAPQRMFYDVDSVDLKAVIPSGASSLVAEVQSIGDCLTWTEFVLVVSRLGANACPGPPTCSACTPPTAALAPVLAICPGDTATLDATPSLPSTCAPLEYQFEDGATVLQPFSSRPTFDVTPLVATTYTGRVRCSADSRCDDTASVLVDVLPDPLPGDQGNVLFAVRRGGDVELSFPSAAAASWRLFADPTKLLLGRTQLGGDTAVPSFLDVGAFARGGDDYYRVKGLSPCTQTPGP